MRMGSGRTYRTAPAFFLCVALILGGGCYAKMYDDPSTDENETALLRGPIGSGFPMKLTIEGKEKPNRTARIRAGHHTLDVQWIGETDAPPDFAKGHLLRVPLRCSITCDLKPGKKYDVTVKEGQVSLYEYDVSKWTGTRRNGTVVESCEGFYVGCCP